MKATNKVSDFTVSNIFTDVKIPESCMIKPHYHETYTWETQDNRFIEIAEVDNRHLLNIYNMLINTFKYAQKYRNHVVFDKTLVKILQLSLKHLHHICYEIHIRKQKALKP